MHIIALNQYVHYNNRLYNIHSFYNIDKMAIQLQQDVVQYKHFLCEDTIIFI